MYAASRHGTPSLTSLPKELRYTIFLILSLDGPNGGFSGVGAYLSEIRLM